MTSLSIRKAKQIPLLPTLFSTANKTISSRLKTKKTLNNLRVLLMPKLPFKDNSPMMRIILQLWIHGTRLQPIWANLSKISQQTILIIMTMNTIKSPCQKELFQWAVKKSTVARAIIRKNVMPGRNDLWKIWLPKFLKAHKLYSLKDFPTGRIRQLIEPSRTRAAHLHFPQILKILAKGTAKVSNRITTILASSKI